MLDKIRNNRSVVLFFLISFLLGHACMMCLNCIRAYNAYRYINLYGNDTMVFEIGTENLSDSEIIHFEEYKGDLEKYMGTRRYEDGHSSIWNKDSVYKLYFNDLFYDKYSKYLCFEAGGTINDDNFSQICGYDIFLKEGRMCANENEVVAYGNFAIGDIVDYGKHKAEVVGILKRNPSIVCSYDDLPLGGKLLLILNPGFIQARDDYCMNKGNDYFSIYITKEADDELIAAPSLMVFDGSKIDSEDMRKLETLGKVLSLKESYAGANSPLAYLSIVYLIGCFIALIVLIFKVLGTISKMRLISGCIVALLPLIILLDYKPLMKVPAILIIISFSILAVIKGVRHELS